MHDNTLGTNNLGGFNIKQIGFYAFLCLLFGHLLLRDYMPHPLVGMFGLMILFIILFYVSCLERDMFGFILIVFICSHFNYANTQGGLWNLLTFGIIIVYYLLVKPGKVFEEPDILIKLLIVVLVVSNITGYILKNPMPTMSRLLGAATFFSYILMYYLASNQFITPERVKNLILATWIAVVCMFSAALNQQHVFMKFNTPLLGGYSAGTGGTIVDAVNRGGSTLNHFELFGEHAMLTITLLIPFMVSRFTQRQLGFKGYMLSLIVMFSMFNILISGTRAPFILVVLAAMLYLIIFIVFPLAVVDTRKSYMLYAVVAIIFVSMLGRFVGLDLLKERMGRVYLSKITVESILSGADINRGPIFSLALQRIQGDSWYIGYGYGVPDSNRIAWFGTKYTPWLSDLHSLYLSLPMVYGWFGSAAFLLIIIVTFIRLTYVALKWRQSKNYLVTLSVGLIFFWVFFMTDQYKVSILRSPNYHMIFWIWLGLSNAVIKTLKEASSEEVGEDSP